MANMVKGRGAHPLDIQSAGQRARRKRGNISDSNHEFVRAFADALRDILHDERRRAA
jgi:hypothetical protein